MIPKADVLIVTATDVECRAVLAAFQGATGRDFATEPGPDSLYLDLGEVKGARVFMALSGIGSGGLGGSQESVRKAIEALSPSAVIMVGIAFGINEAKQRIGDILVSEQLALYDLRQRVGTDKEGHAEIMLRGDRPPATRWLIDQLKVASLTWTESHVSLGLILSGDKLVDNIDFREQLLKFEPVAIGGEMEGAGLYVACQNRKVDWVLVKAICDWADGQKAVDKDARQELAAHNAAFFVLHALQQAPFKPDRDPLMRIGTLSATPREAEPRVPVHSSLPSQPFFFGREKELGIIAEAISPKVRTWGALIDGPGGIGKTALAIRSGHLAPRRDFERKIFLSAKLQELSPAGEQALEDFMLPNYMALLAELARELGEENIAQVNPNERANAVRRALADVRALIVIDNVETFPEPERVRLYQFLSLLPEGCKAIVTSRRRSDIDARVVRLDRLERQEALDLMTELAKSNRHLQKSTDQERGDLYEITNGNPLILRWTVGQLGREGSHCRTIADACAFLKAAPDGNDPLEFVFGDLLDTFTNSETAVLAALAHFTQPAKMDWVADVAEIARPAVRTALEDLTDRALLVSDATSEVFVLPPLAATFLRRKRPNSILQTASHLTDRAYALVLENGFDHIERYPTLEAEWPVLAAALPVFMQGKNQRLQSLCDGLDVFLNVSGRWDEQEAISQRAENRAVAARDYLEAGWRAYARGMVLSERGQGRDVLACAGRCAAYWDKAPLAGAREKATVSLLRGAGYLADNNYPAAVDAYQDALTLFQAIAPESTDVAVAMNDLGKAKQGQGDYAAADLALREGVRIAKKLNARRSIPLYTRDLAELALDREDWAAAEALGRESLQLAETLGRRSVIGEACRVIARALAQQGRPQEGLPYARQAVETLGRLHAEPEFEKAQAALRECGG